MAMQSTQKGVVVVVAAAEEVVVGTQTTLAVGGILDIIPTTMGMVSIPSTTMVTAVIIMAIVTIIIIVIHSQYPPQTHSTPCSPSTISRLGIRLLLLLP